MSLWTPRSCSETSTLIAKATEGTLEQAARDRLMAHLAGCSRCRKQVLAEAAAEAALDEVVGQPLGARTRDCPPDEILEAFATDTLSASERDDWKGHVAECLYCQSEIGQLRRFLTGTADALPELGITVPGHSASQLPSIAAQVRSLSPVGRRYSSSAWVSAVGLAVLLAMAAPATYTLLRDGKHGSDHGTPPTQVASKPSDTVVQPGPQPPHTGATPSQVPVVVPGGQQAQGTQPGAIRTHLSIPSRHHPKRRNAPGRGRIEQTPEPDYGIEEPMLARAVASPSGNGPINGLQIPEKGPADARSVLQGSNTLDDAVMALGGTDATPALVREALATDTPAGTPSNPLPVDEGWELQIEGLEASMETNPLPAEGAFFGASVPDLSTVQEGSTPDAGCH